MEILFLQVATRTAVCLWNERGLNSETELGGEEVPKSVATRDDNYCGKNNFDSSKLT